MKEEFLELLKSIKRDGIDKLINYLETTDFFQAPASSKFHSNFMGGLVEHSIKVYEVLKKDLENSDIKVDEDSIKIVALLHDICKTNYYKVDYRNTKNEYGQWIKVPYYTVDDELPYGHGEKSVYILSSFIKLTREEAMAIRWHMGGFDSSVKGGDFSLSKAFTDYPLALMLHIADMKSTYLFEEVKK